MKGARVLEGAGMAHTSKGGSVLWVMGALEGVAMADELQGGRGRGCWLSEKYSTRETGEYWCI